MVPVLKNSTSFKRTENMPDIYGQNTLKNRIETERMELLLLSTYLDFFDTQIAIAEVLFYLDYATYIPFGKKGERFINDYLSNKGKTATIEDIKRKAMLNVVKKNNIDYSDTNLDNLIKWYCHYLYTDKQDFQSLVSIVATMRRVSGEIDNLVSRNELPTNRTRDDELAITMDQIVGANRNHRHDNLDIGEFMPKCKGEFMTPRELAYFKKLTGLSPEKENQQSNENNM